MPDENILQDLHADICHMSWVAPAIYDIRRLFTMPRRAHHCAKWNMSTLSQPTALTLQVPTLNLMQISMLLKTKIWTF